MDESRDDFVVYAVYAMEKKSYLRYIFVHRIEKVRVSVSKQPLQTV